MQLQLYNQLFKSSDLVSVLNEPDGIAQERANYTNTLKVLKDAQKVLRRDPDISQQLNLATGLDAEKKDERSKEKEKPREEIKKEEQKQPTQMNANKTTTNQNEKNEKDLKLKIFGK